MNKLNNRNQIKKNKFKINKPKSYKNKLQQFNKLKSKTLKKRN